MLNKVITISDIRITKQENFLVNTIVFFTFWSLFTGFPIAFNGIFRTALGGRLGMLLMFVQFLIYVYSVNNTPRSFSQKNQKYALAFIGALLFIWLWQMLSIAEMDNSLIMPLLSIPFFILLRDDLKIISLDRFIRIFAVLLALSLIEYFIYIFTHKGILLYSGLGRAGFDDLLHFDMYNQYLLNIYYVGRDLPRFQCLCEEPGCIGTICGFLLYVTKGRKEYKYQYYVFVLAGVFSFSLAFLAMFALHFFLNSKLSSSALVVILLLYFLVFYVLMDLFQDMLFYRLEEGFQGADNRIVGDFRDTYANAWKNGELWMPHGTEKGSFGAGAKMWIWVHGIVSLIVLFFSYYYIFWKKANALGATRWSCVIFFVAFWMSFYQRHWITNLDYLIVYLTIPALYAYNNTNFSKSLVKSKIEGDEKYH